MLQIDPVVWTWATLGAGALLTALVLAVGHWFPWPRTLDRIPAYIYGVVSILAGFALWRLLNADWQTVVGLVIICCAGGTTVVLAYQIDGWVLAIRQARKAEATDADLAG
jgi:hypothetical protein